MNFDEINQRAWEIAAQAMLWKNNKFEAYSHKQIRGFFELAKSPSFEENIEAHIHRYQPQPTQREKPRETQAQMLEERREVNKKVGDRIKKLCESLKPDEKTRFFQYLLWNVKIIENLSSENPIEKITLVLTAEQIKNPQSVIEHLTKLKRDKKPRKPIKRR
jgi:hypothetical protein